MTMACPKAGKYMFVKNIYYIYVPGIVLVPVRGGGLKRCDGTLNRSCCANGARPKEK